MGHDIGQTEETPEARTARLAKRVETAGWGLFILWIGIAILADLGWGLGVLGAGVLAIAEQLLRKSLRLPVEGFWVVVGFMAVAVGIWLIYGATFSLLGLILILAGAGLVMVSLFQKT
jgi:hypothetical protein